MSQQMPFIGRQEELKQIDDFITEWGTRRVLCIHGPGGIGKTRLLAEIQNLYNNSQEVPLLVADILDFDDRSLHLAENIESEMASQLDEQAFGPYLRRLLDLRKIAAAGVSVQTLKEDSERVQQLFLDTFNQLSSTRRLVLLLDTTEKLENKEVWNRIINLIVESKNSLFVLAGRNAKELWQALHFQLGEEAQLIELEAFEDKFGEEYLDQKQEFLNVNFGPQLKPKLLLLTGGRAILLDLAAEWLSRDLPLSWMTKKTLQELQALSEEEMVKHKKDFEVQLVREIQQIRDQMDRLTLMMSRVYPLTAAMIAHLLRRSPEEADRLFDDALTYVFVKPLPDGRISLHDEMRRMINEHVWPEVDPDKFRRRRDSRLAVKLFESEEQELKQRLTQRGQIDLADLFEREALLRRRETVNVQQIEHALYANLNSGFQAWKRIVDERRTEKSFQFARNSLLPLARPYYEHFRDDDQFEFDMLVARLRSDTGEVHQAQQMLLRLLSENQGQQNREANIYNALALAEEKLGRLSLALEHQLNALKIVSETNPKFIPPVANRVGWLYQALGEHDKAEPHYNDALNEALNVEKGSRNLRLIASLFNNLGYIYGTRGQYYQMEANAGQAIEIWRRIGAEREIGLAEFTRAIVYRDDNRFQLAINLLEKAIARYEEPDDHERLSRAYFELGWTKWYQAETVDEKASDISALTWNKKLLIEARADLEKSKELSEKYNLEALLPGVWHITSLVYWYLGRVDNNDPSLAHRARELNHDSYEKSKQVGDTRFAISCLLADAEWDYEIGQYNNIEAYAQELEQEYSTTSYPLYFGRMRRIEGDVAFNKGEVDTAFAKYAEGLLLIDRVAGFGRYTTERELLRLGNKMQEKMRPDDIEKWANYLRDKWQKVDNQDTRSLITWSGQQIRRAKLRSIDL